MLCLMIQVTVKLTLVSVIFMFTLMITIVLTLRDSRFFLCLAIGQNSKRDPCPFERQVIYRTLPKWESLDPFGTEGQQQLRVTNIRIRLLKQQQCPCQDKDLGRAATEPLPTRHFAIYDLIVKGSCFCNGHAEQCVPAPGYRPIRDRTNHVVRWFVPDTVHYEF